MTALAPFAPAADGTAARDALSTYTDQTGNGPILGHVVVYSVHEGQITLPEATTRFQDLGLDTSLLPKPLRADDAFLRVTGSNGVHDTYNLDDLDTGTPDPLTPAPAGPARSASLMIRPVRRDAVTIVRHIVREERDETAATLNYKEHLGEIVFERTCASSGPGQMTIRLDATAVAELSEAEQERVHALVEKVYDRYRWQCVYLGADRIRSLLLDYMRRLDAVPVRPTGGVYFVVADHAPILAGLHEFIDGIGAHSMFARIPLPNEAEMRQLIIRSYIASATEALQKLSMDIATARRDGLTNKQTLALFERFRTLKDQAARYSQRLSTSLDETSYSLDLVETQLTALLQSS